VLTVLLPTDIAVAFAVCDIWPVINALVVI